MPGIDCKTVRTVARPERRVAERLPRLELELPTRDRILGEAAAAIPTSNPV